MGQTDKLQADAMPKVAQKSHLSHYDQIKVGRCKSSIYAVVPLVPPVPPENSMIDIDRARAGTYWEAALRLDHSCQGGGLCFMGEQEAEFSPSVSLM